MSAKNGMKSEKNGKMVFSFFEIKGNIEGARVSSRVLEERIQEAVKDGARELHVTADGQHGIGGRIWPREAPVRITVEGPVGQRLGSMGMEGTHIVVNGSASDAVGFALPASS
ncbi:MAG: hypothetical protein M0Z75_04740 [Nitrospiraceae bacterium]|nr:hypothetical protein [Nitrospiraceae bacterium]